MTTEELERHIEGQSESQNLDFKADSPWDVKKMAKDFLSMSNVQDGGLIIIGVEESELGFRAVGIGEGNLKTYVFDDMKDQLASYAEPAVQFTVYTPKDFKDRQYVVIKIHPFAEYPVLSKKDIDKELKSNTIYYRNSHKRPQSAPVANLTDLQDIIERSAIKLIAKRKKLGYSVDSASESFFEKEINEIGQDEILDKIKSGGYWRVYFEPQQNENISLTKDCLELVEKSRINTSWPFPFTNLGYPGASGATGSNFYQGRSDFGARKELWRMYTSGLFVCFNALPEDWYKEDRLYQSLAAEVAPNTQLTVYNSLIFYISSVYSFLSRMVANGLYKNGVEIHLQLYRLKNRSLRLDHPGKSPLFRKRITLSDSFAYKEKLDSTEVLTNHQVYANKCIIKLLDIFNYNPPPDSIMIEQENYLNGRL
jgi:hypothetical protein